MGHQGWSKRVQGELRWVCSRRCAHPDHRCGICGREAEVVATVPMCGERPRFPLCHACLDDLTFSDFTEDVVPL